MNRLQIYFISEVTFYKLLAQVTSSYIVIILQPFPSIDRSINLTAVLCLCYKSIVRVKFLFTSRSLELHRVHRLTNFSFDRSINLTAVLCLCYKSILRVNRSENLTNFYLISEVTRWGDATLMLGRHNSDVGAT